jgi:hypothetical protein
MGLAAGLSSAGCQGNDEVAIDAGLPPPPCRVDEDCPARDVCLQTDIGNFCEDAGRCETSADCSGGESCELVPVLIEGVRKVCSFPLCECNDDCPGDAFCGPTTFLSSPLLVCFPAQACGDGQPCPHGTTCRTKLVSTSRDGGAPCAQKSVCQ